ncbi:MAG: hypothetical protein RR718_09160, partial [Comamonas sp.]
MQILLVTKCRNHCGEICRGAIKAGETIVTPEPCSAHQGLLRQRWSGALSIVDAGWKRFERDSNKGSVYERWPCAKARIADRQFAKSKGFYERSRQLLPAFGSGSVTKPI